MALTLHGSTLSPFVRKCYVVMTEKGVAFEMQMPGFPLPEDFRAISPLKKQPVLQDTDRPEPNCIPDSSVICDYIEHLQPQPPLYPADPFERARALWLEEYADGGLFPLMGPGLFVQRVALRLIGQEGDEARAKHTVAEELPAYFDYLDEQAKDRKYLAGGAYSIADIAVASLMVNYAHAGETLDADRWPHLAAHTARIHARPAFADIIAREEKFITRILGG